VLQHQRGAHVYQKSVWSDSPSRVPGRVTQITSETHDGAGRTQAAGPLPAVSPFVLSEVQALILPLGMVLGAMLAKVIYLDLILRASAPATEYLGAGILAAVVLSVIARQFDINSPSSIVAGQPRSGHILIAVGLSFLFLLVLFYLLKVSEHYSRGWLLLWFGLSLAFLLLAHFGVLLWARLLRAERRLLQRVAIYGHVDLARRVRDKLFANGNLELAGVFSDSVSQTHARGIPVAGDMRALIAKAQSGACDRVILALPSEASQEICDAVASLEVLPIEVQLSPDAMALPSQLRSAEAMGGLVLLDLQLRPLSARDMLLKSMIDYALATIALIVFTPVMLAIAIAIKLDTRGPVFFVQSRHGYNHRIIRVIKFRTMTVAEDGPVVVQAVRDDKRVTRVGRFLRRTSLDELPQLINVARGDLSLVGPRPHAVTHNESFDKLLSQYANRLKVKPGITGWAQVNGLRGETKTVDAMRQRLDFDLYYIKHWSLWMDAKILARTVFVPFFGAEAY
jgi:Undecaprenyl-phosphate glucose phosphotransferase